MSRAVPWPVCLAILLTLILAGCGSPAASAPAPAPTVATSSLQLAIASTDLAQGRNRFTFGVLDGDHPLSTDHARVTFFSLHGNYGTAVETDMATFNHFSAGLKDTAANSAAIDIKGVYVTYPVFSHAGTWGAEVHILYRGRMRAVRQSFVVRQHSITPAIGSPAPRSNNPTVAQEPATKLDSGRPPDDMHRLSIAQVIAQHRPLLVLFATAGFCTSRMCGPEIQVVEGLERQYRGRMAFVHIEIYKDANPAHGYAPTVLQWRLQTEPWVFVVNRRGIIVAKFEGPTTAAEIRPAIESALR